MSFKKIVCSILSLCIASSASAGVPVPPPDDNGQASFVRQVVPKLLGRRPKGTVEVELLADFADLLGREGLVRMLMERREFLDHWTALLIDDLKVQREGGLAQNASCYDAPSWNPSSSSSSNLTFEPGGKIESVASFVRGADIESQHSQTFNMYDLIQASIALDDVFPIYRAHLFSLGHKVRAPGMAGAPAQRARIGAAFDDVFIGRDLECMACHNSSWAVTQSEGNHHPIHSGLDPLVFAPVGVAAEDIEIDAYTENGCAVCHGAAGDAVGGEIGGSILGATAASFDSAVKNIPEMAMFDPDNDEGVEEPAISEGDVSEILSLLAMSNPDPFSSGAIGGTAERHFGVFRRDFFQERFCEDGQTACGDNADCEATGLETCSAGEVGFGPWGISTDCAAIADSEYEGDVTAYFSGVTAERLTVADVDDSLVAGYEQLPGAATATADTAFAYMVAAKVTENVWNRLMGGDLTLVNRYARNSYQSGTHQYLTEEVFIEQGWSLKELIVAILGERFFNRRAPVDSYASKPFALPPMWDAFAPKDKTCEDWRAERKVDDLKFRHAGSVDPTGPGELHSNDLCAFNGQGELVHRYAPRTLMTSTAAALGWRPPKIFPGAGYPSNTLQRSIGQYVSDEDPGAPAVDFQSLLYWDDTYGMCKNRNVGSGDWIDKLTKAVDEWNDEDEKDPLVVRDVVMTMKDWILQEPTLTPYVRPVETRSWTTQASLAQSENKNTETADLEELFGQAIGSSIPVANSVSFKNRLRELCGAYLRSPQFMLAGVVRPDEFEAPRLRVCNDGACTYREMCESYGDTLGRMGEDVSCVGGLNFATPNEWVNPYKPEPPKAIGDFKS